MEKKKRKVNKKAWAVVGGLWVLVIGGYIAFSIIDEEPREKADMTKKGGIGVYPEFLEYEGGDTVNAYIINIDKASGEYHIRLQGALSDEPVKGVSDYDKFKLDMYNNGGVVPLEAPEEPGKYQLVVKGDSIKGELWSTEFEVK